MSTVKRLKRAEETLQEPGQSLLAQDISSFRLLQKGLFWIYIAIRAGPTESERAHQGPFAGHVGI